jgi:hypothetical protein
MMRLAADSGSCDSGFLAMTPTESYLISLGRLVLQYNEAETRLRRLLVSAFEPISPRDVMLAQIMTVELGNVGLTQALQSYANDLAPLTIREHILHAGTYFDRIREYRNFYVHGVTSVMGRQENPIGLFHTRTAKGSLKDHKGFVSKADLDQLTAHCETAGAFTNAVSNRLSFVRGDWFGDLPEPPLPDKPPLPDRLQKPAQHWREYFPPPQASQP